MKPRIALRILAFNLLVLFLPVAGILYLDIYEDRLLDMQESGMVEEARLVAAALRSPEDAAAFLTRLASESDSRIRVFDTGGRVVADSRRLLGEPAAASTYGAVAAKGRDPFLYRVGAWLVRVKRAAGSWIRPDASGRLEQAGVADDRVPPEVVEALAGRYGAATRRTPGQRSMTLNSAMPIVHDRAIVGAVLVSRSTFRVLQALYTVRLRIFEVVIASVVVAALLSALMSATIVRPLVRLKRAASMVVDRRTPLSRAFTVVNRRDEIGDLARSLEELVRRLEDHIRLLESFAADVSHEFKNPLASIRTAAEMLVSAEDPQDRQRFFAMLTRDVDRLERLVSGVRELARIDAQLAHEPATAVDIGALLNEATRGMSAAGARVALAIDPERGCFVRASHDRLLQVFENLLENAHSFAPEGTIDVSVVRTGSSCRVSIADSGPGIPDAHLERVFERFFTYRPGASKARREHTGLGLSIARTIVEGYGGTITAANQAVGGACFVVELPLELRTSATERHGPRRNELSHGRTRTDTERV